MEAREWFGQIVGWSAGVQLEHGAKISPAGSGLARRQEGSERRNQRIALAPNARTKVFAKGDGLHKARHPCEDWIYWNMDGPGDAFPRRARG